MTGVDVVRIMLIANNNNGDETGGSEVPALHE